MIREAVGDLSQPSADGVPDRLRSYPHYGVDAPRVAATLVGGGASTTLIGAILAGPRHRRVGLLGAAGVPPLLLGVSMLVYAFLGKQRLRDHLLRQRAWRGDEVVLDVGAGRGLMAIGAAQRAPRGEVLALDVWSQRDLSGNDPSALLRNAVIENVVDTVTVVTGDARQLDLADESVDVVVSVFCLHNITPVADRMTACAEIARVLKPGGSAMIADFPTARPYVQPLRDAGLRVGGPLRSDRIALGGISGYLTAHKPLNAPP
jgi:SAM-dependent methyltransferase